jgi:hypothetical protein
MGGGAGDISEVVSCIDSKAKAIVLGVSMRIGKRMEQKVTRRDKGINLNEECATEKK